MSADARTTGRWPRSVRRGRAIRPRQRGFALVTAIFLLVVLAALSLYLLSLAGTQHMTAAWAAQSARAHYAAQSGIEWGAWQALNGGGCNGVLSVDTGGASPFTVTVSCGSSSHQERGDTLTVWTIDAVAHTGTLGSPAFVQRSQRAVVVDGP